MGRKPSNLPIDQQVSYNAETGRFYRRADIKIDAHGYRVVSINGQEYRAHRLAWFLTHGYWPPDDIDHINRKRDDNRLVNLRCATRSQNLRNSLRKSTNTSGFKGVFYNNGRWMARITIHRKARYLGCYATRQLASECYQLAADLAADAA